jgi:hypothetical protein
MANIKLRKIYGYRPLAIAAAFVGIAIGAAAIANSLGFNLPLTLILSPAQPLVIEKQSNGSVSKVVSLLLGGYILGASTTGLKSLLHRIGEK